jgi:uncharacterized protein YkwD
MPRIRALAAASLLALALVLPTDAARASTAEERMVEKINEVRRSHGRGGLQTSRSLTRSSGRYARWLMARDAFGHRSRLGISNWFRRRGEVLEMHGGGSPRVGSAVRAWMRSSGHRRVIMGRFGHVGAGMSVGRWRGRQATIWVVHVGAR